MNKRNIFEQIKANLESMLRQAEKNRKDAQDEANHHKGAMESRYDTFKEEAQYLAAAHEARIAELRASLSQVQAILERIDVLAVDGVIRIGSIVCLEVDDGTVRKYVVSTTGGGMQIEDDGETFLVITPDAPLGREMLGKQKDDEVEVRVRENITTYEITEVF